MTLLVEVAAMRDLSYKYRMSKQAISVTLDADNLVWLKGRADAAGLRSVSELLDRIVTAARGANGAGVSRSVIGTVGISPADPNLDQADAAIRATVERSLGRPFVVRETPPRYGGRAGARAHKRTRRG